MKASSRTKVGNRSGNPGYRTQATFRGNRVFALPKGLSQGKSSGQKKKAQ